MTIITTVPGAVDPAGLIPGQTITQTLEPVWQAHKQRHLELCGSVAGPLAALICRQGHRL